jgi:hypothetical protein
MMKILILRLKLCLFTYEVKYALNFSTNLLEKSFSNLFAITFLRKKNSGNQTVMIICWVK